ncbi:MAG: glycosyltransferase, partial [Tepidisphaeraceae bacterium]
PDRPRWEAFVREHGLDNVTFYGFLPDDKMWVHIRHGHVMLFPIRPTDFHKTRCPSKTFRYAQTRRPTITCRVGEVAEVLGDQAIYVDPTPQAWADAIRKYMQTQLLPEVDFHIEEHSYANRGKRLTDALAARGVRL